MKDTTIQQSDTLPDYSTPQQNTYPSLTGSCSLIEFNISQWTGRCQDRGASSQVTASNNADVNVASVYKSLLGDNLQLDAIKKFVGLARSTVYQLTVPWSDNGLRMIPNGNILTFTNKLSELEQKYWKLVETFLKSYDWAVIEAQTKLGDLFNQKDYPDVNTLRGKFSWRLNVMALPSAPDFRVDIGKEQEDAMKKNFEEYYNRMFTKAIISMVDPLQRMSERLDFKDDESKKTFRDTLVSNVTNAISLLGITDDPEITKLRKSLQELFKDVTPDELRKDATLRKQVKTKVDEAIKQIKTLDF